MPGPRETLGTRENPGWSSGRWALVACVALGLLGLAGCNWLFPRPEPPPEWVPSIQTRVLDEGALAVRTNVDAGGTLTFSSPSPMLDALEPGDVIVLGVTPQTPFGLLRRAIAIDRQGGRTIIATEQATLVDALDEGRIHVSGTLTSEDALTTTTVEGVELVPSRIGQLRFNLNTEVVSGVWVRGELCLSVDFDFTLDIRRRGVDYVNFETTITQTADLRVEATAGFGGEVEEKLIFRRYFKPFVVKFIVIVPVVSIYVGVDGTVQASFSAGVTQETSLTAGARYRKESGWTNLSGFDPRFYAGVPDAPSAVLRGEAYAKGELGLMIYAVIGPYAVARPYLELNVNPTASPWWELYGGLSCYAGVKLEITQLLTASHETGELAGIRRLIRSADSGTQIDPVLSARHYGLQDLAFSPDGRYLASCAEKDWSVIIWDLVTGEKAHTIQVGSDGTPADVGGVRALAFSPDGSMLATGGWNGIVKLWGVGTWQHLRSLERPGAPRSMEFSPDGRVLAVATARELYLWDPHTGLVRHALRAEGSHLSPDRAAFNPNGRVIAQTANRDRKGLVILWDTLTGQQIATFELEGYVSRLAFGIYHRGDMIVLGSPTSSTRGLRAIDAATGAIVYTALPDRAISAVTFSPCSTFIAAGLFGGSIGSAVIVNAQSGTTLCVLDQVHSTIVHVIKWSKSGHLLAAGGTNHQIMVFDVGKLTTQ